MATTLALHTLHLKLVLQILCESRRFMGIGVVQGCKGVGDVLGIQGGSGGICMFRVTLLDWQKNSDLGSKSATDTSYILLCLT